MATRTAAAEPAQLDFSFMEERAQAQADERQAKLERAQREAWLNCWGWPGPAVGQHCEIDSATVELAEPRPSPFGGELLTYSYFYMERARLVEERPDGRWLAEIDMLDREGRPWSKNGTRVLLSIIDIWPPVRDLLAARAADTRAEEDDPAASAPELAGAETCGPEPE